MLHRFFDKTVVLSQWHRDDRQRHFEQEAFKYNLEYNWYWASKNDNPYHSFNISQYGIIKEYYELGAETLLVLEDDCMFQNMDQAEELMMGIPYDWHMLYLGCNAKPYDECPKPVHHSKSFVRIRSAYTTHAVAYKRDVMEMILDFYKPLESVLYDAWLCQVILPIYKAYCTLPFLAVQRPVHSDLWNRSVDYTDTFKNSEEYLKSI